MPTGRQPQAPQNPKAQRGVSGGFGRAAPAGTHRSYRPTGRCRGGPTPTDKETGSEGHAGQDWGLDRQVSTRTPGLPWELGAREDQQDAAQAGASLRHGPPPTKVSLPGTCLVWWWKATPSPFGQLNSGPSPPPRLPRCPGSLQGARPFLVTNKHGWRGMPPLCANPMEKLRPQRMARGPQSSPAGAPAPP